MRRKNAGWHRTGLYAHCRQIGMATVNEARPNPERS
jgi:hypothetical protein